MTNIIALKYPVGDRVWIEDAEVWGRVQSIQNDGSRTKYEVSWFDEDKRLQEAWFIESELKRSKTEV